MSNFKILFTPKLFGCKKQTKLSEISIGTRHCKISIICLFSRSFYLRLKLKTNKKQFLKLSNRTRSLY